MHFIPEESSGLIVLVTPLLWMELVTVQCWLDFFSPNALARITSGFNNALPLGTLPIKKFIYWKKNFVNRLFPEMDRSIILLTKCYFTPLWSYVQSLPYLNKPETLHNSQLNIERLSADIRPNLCEKIMANCIQRIQSMEGI